MKIKYLFVAIIITFLCGCSHLSKGVVFQNAPIDALMAGQYEGTMAFGDLKKQGDFGIGTLDKLDGEMVALGGKFYQVKIDGKVYEVSDCAKTPFATVVFFEPSKKYHLSGSLDYEGLCVYLDKLLPSKNIFYAVKITGRFKTVKARSVPAQAKPYPALAKAIEGQKIFEFRDIEGTLIGFRFPAYVGGFNVSGYHFHFLNKNKDAGGHILDLRIEDGLIEVDKISRIFVELPESGDFLKYESAGSQGKD